MAVTITSRRYEIILTISFIIAFLTSQQILFGYYITYTNDHLNHNHQPSSSHHSNIDNTFYNYDPPALPSILISSKKSKQIERGIYGGNGDKPHLGGFTNIDFDGLSPRAFKTMIEIIGVKSLLDIGCGKGLSTSYFHKMGVDVLCAEGSHDAVTQTLLPPERVVEHDFSRGPWWPAGGKTFDAVWCVEFLEHVGRNYHQNYIPAFKRAALIFATHSNWGGWHHVEVHDDDWWITKMEMYGLVHSKYLTELVRSKAMDGNEDPIGKGGNTFHAQHIWLSMMVFINPSVASLPKHHHLLAEAGCYDEDEKRKVIHRNCDRGEETPLPKEWQPLKVKKVKVNEWIAFLEDKLGLNEVTNEGGEDEKDDEDDDEEEDEEEEDEEEEDDDEDEEEDEEEEDDDEDEEEDEEEEDDDEDEEEEDGDDDDDDNEEGKDKEEDDDEEE